MDRNWKWKESLKKHFGPSSCSKWRQLATDVQCVVLGLKPAYLLDCLEPHAPKLCSVVEDALHLQRRWTNGEDEECEQTLRVFRIVSVGSDVLVVNWDCLREAFKLQGQADCSFVDVSKPHPAQPTRSRGLLRRESALVASIEEEMNSWYSYLLAEDDKLHLSPSKNGKLLKLLSTAVLPGLNVCTLFGRLLGYPVVYWFDPAVGYSLDMTELKLYHIHLTGPENKVSQTKLINFVSLIFSLKWQPGWCPPLPPQKSF